MTLGGERRPFVRRHLPVAAGLIIALAMISGSLGALDRDVLSFNGWAGGGDDGAPTLVLPRPAAVTPAI